MTANKESLYWKTNKEWYFVNEKGEFELKDNVPQKVKESFKLYKGIVKR